MSRIRGKGLLQMVSPFTLNSKPKTASRVSLLWATVGLERGMGVPSRDF